MNRNQRFQIFLHKLANSPAVPQSRADAFQLVKDTLTCVEDEHSGYPPDDYQNRMHVFGMSAGMGWEQLNGDPCTWVDSVQRKHKLALHNDGRILISEVKSGKVLLNKP